jgi:hypothetical protein
MPNENKNGDRKQRPPKTPESPYARSVLALYTELPNTPARPRHDDRFVVRQLELQKHPLIRVHAALLLGTARRIFRPDNTLPLLPIRSFRFFLPVLDELRFANVDQAYLRYLARKLEDFLGKDLPLNSPTLDESRSARSPRRPRQLKLPW